MGAPLVAGIQARECSMTTNAQTAKALHNMGISWPAIALDLYHRRACRSAHDLFLLFRDELGIDEDEAWRYVSEADRRDEAGRRV